MGWVTLTELIYSPTKDILFAEARGLQSQLPWTQQAANQQIHDTKEAAAQKLVNALSGYRDEFRDAREHHEEKLNTHQAQQFPLTLPSQRQLKLSLQPRNSMRTWLCRELKWR